VKIIANLVIGADGSTTSNSSSKGLSSKADRERFHALRKSADAILIGGNSARNEPYSVTPIPLFVISKSRDISEVSANEKCEILNVDPKTALEIIRVKGFETLLIEGGPNLLLELIGEINELFITISTATGDGQVISFDGITRNFVMEDKEEVDGEIFYTFKKMK
jgi:riboflavin biosynthesis pyrimidine reductase